MICVRLLDEWSMRAGLNLDDPRNRLAPRQVRQAERYMIDHAADLPTIAEVARVIGASVRTLSGTFKAFRGYAPSTFLREQRLQGAYRPLQAACSGKTAASIASEWGCINMG